MANVNHETVERYQLLYERDPKSKVFAPLAEAYRKMDLHNRALALCQEGLQNHPDFAGGHITLARVLIDLGEPQKAIEHLEKATELAPDNVLAHSLLAETYLRKKEYREALKAYKMFLFLSPESQTAQKAVKKLEGLLAQEFLPNSKVKTSIRTYEVQGPKILEPAPTLPTPERPQKTNSSPYTSSRERFLYLADAHIMRNDRQKALGVLSEALSQLGDDSIILAKINSINSETEFEVETLPTNDFPLKPKSRREEVLDQKIGLLKSKLSLIAQRRKDAKAH